MKGEKKKEGGSLRGNSGERIRDLWIRGGGAPKRGKWQGGFVTGEKGSVLRRLRGWERFGEKEGAQERWGGSRQMGSQLQGGGGLGVETPWGVLKKMQTLSGKRQCRNI